MITIPITRFTPLSLSWQGDQLIDWVRGGDIYGIDGAFRSGTFALSYGFDAAIVSPSGRFQVVYEKLRTKGVLMEGNKILREINRSYYCASAYEFPIALFQLPDGREVMAHCPERFSKLEIEETETGKQLTQRETELETSLSQHFFHSRLATNKSGKYLMSAGWIWSPFSSIEIFDTQDAVRDPSYLDTGGHFLKIGHEITCEISSACFLNDEDVLLNISSKSEDLDDGEPEEERRSSLRPGTLGVFNLASKTWKKVVPLAADIGTMFVMDENHVLGVYEYPRLIEISTGAVVQEWPELSTGQQNSSIIHHIKRIPAMAYDATNRRFAVVNDRRDEDRRIEIITIPEHK